MYNVNNNIIGDTNNVDPSVNTNVNTKKKKTFFEKLKESYELGELDSAIVLTGNLLNTTFSNGVSTTAGNMLSGVGGIASTINPIAGAAITAAGGLVNGLFGSKVNHENLAKINTLNTLLANTVLDDSSYDGFLSDYSGTTLLGDVKKSTLGKEGIFSNKISKLANRVNADRDLANLRFNSSVQNSLNNIKANEAFSRSYAALGGPLTEINAGGTHELNPYEGVPMGIAPDGLPNVVELGETIKDNYVFSDRLEVPKEVKTLLKLPKTIRTFADASKYLAKESEERPNDPISKKAFEASTNQLKQIQEIMRQQILAQLLSMLKNMFSFGGDLIDSINNHPVASAIKVFDPTGITSYYDVAQEYNKFKKDPSFRNGVDLGIEALGALPLVGKLGKVLKVIKGFNKTAKATDAVNLYKTLFTLDPLGALSLGKDLLDGYDYHLSKKDNRRYSSGGGLDNIFTTKNGYPDYSDIDSFFSLNMPRILRINPFTGRVPFNPYSTYPIPIDLSKPDLTPQGKIEKIDGSGLKKSKVIPDAGTLEKAKNNTEEDKKPKLNPGLLRYAPALGASIGLMSNWLDKPDYSNADRVFNYAREAAKYDKVNFNPIGDYLNYVPLDTDYALNKANALFGATNRSIANMSGGNKSAAISALLANNYNTINATGDLYRNALAYNLDLKARVADFNRGTNMTNAEGLMRADIANQQAAILSRGTMFDGMYKSLAMRDMIDLNRANAIQANLTNLFTSLGNIGTDYVNRQDALGTINSLGRVISDELLEKMSAFLTEKERQAHKNSTRKSKENG